MNIEKEEISNDYLLGEFITPYLKDMRVSELKAYSSDVYDTYLVGLCGKISEILNRTLMYDLQKYIEEYDNKDELKNKREEYKKFILSKDGENYVYEKYPLLKDKLDIVFESMTSYYLEIITNFENNKSEIQKTFMPTNSKMKIEKINISEGDLHDGKSVATITFVGGNKLIYKPQNTYNAILFNMLVDFIDKNDSKIGYKSSKRIISNNHTWEELITQKPCYTRKEVENYYYRSGVLGFILYILNSTDMHHENIICHGEYPIIIDFETLSNSFVKEYNVNQNYRNPLYSVVNTGLFPYVSPTAAIDINMGGILSAVSGKSDKIFEEVAKIDSQGNVTYEKHAAYIKKLSNYLDYLGDDPKLLNCEIKNKIIDGFRNAGAIVYNNKNVFFKIIDDFCSKNILEFRQLLRPTQVYFKFIQASLHPMSLSSLENYEDIFDILLTKFKAGKHGYLRVSHEIEDMKKLNVPLFYSKYEDTNLYTKGDKIVNSKYYAVSIKDSIKHKLEYLNENLIEYQIKLIEMSIFIIEKDEDMGKTYLQKINEKERENNSDQITEEFVKRLLSLEFKLSPNLSTFYIPQFFPLSNNPIKLSNIDYQIYQGGGLILVLMYYGYYNNKKEYLEYAKRLYTMLVNNLDMNSITDLSAYTGYGSLLYISYNLYKVTKDDKHLQEFLELTDRFLLIALNRIDEANVMDMIGGISSTLYFLAKIKEEQYIKKFSSKLLLLYNRLLKNKYIYENNEIGMAHGISGIALSISAFYKLTPTKEVLDIILSLLNKENELIEKDLNEIPNSWCRGKAGILLARNLISKNLVNTISDAQHELINKYNSEFINTNLLDMNNLCLCHGVYGNIEILNFLNKNFYKNHQTKDLFKKRFNSFNDLQWIENSDYPLESFMLGNGGITYVMMQEKFNIPSILALELFDDKEEYLK